ncbi:MAG: hypothetical protein ACTHM9_09510 [Gemmatimonadales bacterium]
MRHRPIAQDSPPTQFGMFYPVGYLAVAFRHEDDAGRARDALVAGGYDSGDVQLVSAREVIAGATRSLETASPLVRVLGWERDALAAHAELAARGFTFILAYAPSNLDTERVMAVVRRFEYGLAHKFDRFAVHVL